MSIKQRFLKVSNLLFVVLILIELLLPAAVEDPKTIYLVVFASAIEVLALVVSALVRKKGTLNLFNDILAFIYGFFIFWSLFTEKFNLLKEALFPPFGRVIEQFIEDIDKIAVNIYSSMGIIVQGYLLAVVVAIPLGLILGWNIRLGGAATKIADFLGSIPPIVYIPYGIVLLPTFRSVSVFVIFLATFWPVLAGTMSGVLNVEKKMVDSAKVLNLSKFTMLSSVILPSSLPQIFQGCNMGLTLSFILLTSAEMIGARNGLGYYVKSYSDLGDYTRTIVGLIVIGIVVVVISVLFKKLQNFLLRWKS